MYVVKKHNGRETVFVTVEPVLRLEKNQFPVCFAWTLEKAAAVRFTTRWHAHAVARKLPGRGAVVRVAS